MVAKSRADINRDYAKRRAKKPAEEPATRTSSVPKSSPPPKKKRLEFANAEPPTTIGAIPWLPELDADAALAHMKRDSFW